MKRHCRLWSFFAVGLVLVGSVALGSPGPDSLPIIAHGELRQEIKATPIEERPNRPLHFYGNAVRRAAARHGRSPNQALPGRNAASSAK